MYDYVRRQQEAQPHLFASKTFRWVDSSLQEPSWVKVCSTHLPSDPMLASPSIGQSPRQHAPRSSSRLAILGIFQRPFTGSTSSHPNERGRSFVNRRPRRNSDAAATAMPARNGALEATVRRRRGFTTPLSAQPPFATASFDAATIVGNGSSGSGSGSYPLPAHGLISHSTPDAAQILPHRAVSHAYVSANNNSNQSDARSIGSPTFSHFAGQHPLLPPPSSSPFSSQNRPSLLHRAQHAKSPQTICSKARSLMHKVRLMPQNRDRRRMVHGGPPYTISSVLHASDEVILGNNGADVQRQNFFTKRRLLVREMQSSTARRGNVRPVLPSRERQHQHQQHTTPITPLAVRSALRTLPKSPLVNSLDAAEVLSEGEVDCEDDRAAISTKVGRQTVQTIPAPKTASSDSSDEDVKTCLVCARHEGHDWTVECSAGHSLCFSCVQAHAKTLLAETRASTVVCPTHSCSAIISTRFLSLCLPPQRLEQLAANRRQSQSKKALNFVRRSLSFTGTRRSGGPSAREDREKGLFATRSSSSISEEGFDAPIILAEARSSLDASQLTSRKSSPAANDNEGVDDRTGIGFSRGGGGLVAALEEPSAAPAAAEDVLADSISELRVSGAQQSRDMQTTATAARVMAAAEELQPATEDGSGNKNSNSSTTLPNIVDGHTNAESADSAMSLSPASAESPLRRVPKARGGLAPKASPGAQNGSELCAKMSPLSLNATVVSHSDTPLQNPASALYSYAELELDSYMRSSPPQKPRAVPARPFSCFPADATPPPVPPPAPAVFRETATWITPEQRYSGFAENLVLNATLFETIRHRESFPSNSDEGANGQSNKTGLNKPATSQKQGIPAFEQPVQYNDQPEDDGQGVYIPTWCRPNTGTEHRTLPLWAGPEFGSQSGVLCEIAELNFDLYETLHKRR